MLKCSLNVRTTENFFQRTFRNVNLMGTLAKHVFVNWETANCEPYFCNFVRFLRRYSLGAGLGQSPSYKSLRICHFVKYVRIGVRSVGLNLKVVSIIRKLNYVNKLINYDRRKLTK